MSRSMRFGETADEYRMLAAFTGEAVKSRMDRIRELIVEVRRAFHEPNSALMHQVRELFSRLVSTASSQEFVARTESLFTGRRGFTDLYPDLLDKSYSAVWLYTSNEGYGGPFKWAKNILRSEASTDTELRAATFLVELINIDLFNYWHTRRSNASFAGSVYRGLWMTDRDFEELEQKAHDVDVRKRYRSVPLALDSCSNDPERALEFVRKGTGDVPVLQKIRILDLSQPSLTYYQHAYPESVVSTICATEISEVSAFPREGEVLLRGGFYQLLDVKQTADYIQDRPLRVVKMVTMSTNRDHPSTPQGMEGDAPRQLIGSLITAERDKFCRNYYWRLNLPEHAGLYEKALTEQDAAFRREFGEAPPWLGRDQSVR